MTQEEKELLFQDLCARLPYGVQVAVDADQKFEDSCDVAPMTGINLYHGTAFPHLKGEYLITVMGTLTPFSIEEVRPLLRPMSSMTKEEKRELKKLSYSHMNSYLEIIQIPYIKGWGFLNSIHIDYRGLIDKGLALPAPEGNNKYYDKENI